MVIINIELYTFTLVSWSASSRGSALATMVCHISGSGPCVEAVVSSDIASLTVHDLIEKLKAAELSEVKSYDQKRVPSSNDDQDQDKDIILPPMKVQFKGPNWNAKAASTQVTTWMSLLGFGRAGVKSYKCPDDEPSWFCLNRLKFSVSSTFCTI